MVHDEERLRLDEELAEYSRAVMNLLVLTWVLWLMAQTFLQFGQRGRAEDIVTGVKTLAERNGQPNLLMLTMCNDAIMAFWDGHLEEVVAIRCNILTRAEELGALEFATAWAIWTITAREQLGDAGRALESVLQGTRILPRNLADEMTILFCLAHLGRYGEAVETLERLVVARPGIGSAEDESQTSQDVISLEAAVLARHR